MTMNALTAAQLLRVVGYLLMVSCGMLLGGIALGRMRMLLNGRRRLYRTLAMIAFGLAWMGLFGLFGLWQYGNLLGGLQVPLEGIALGFSVSILWVACWMVILVVLVFRDEVLLVMDATRMARERRNS